MYGRQRPQLTGPNRPIGSIPLLRKGQRHAWKSSPDMRRGSAPHSRITHRNLDPPDNRSLTTDRVDWTTWWFWRGARTRSHPELGRENPQRPWYCVLRHGRVGRRQVFQSTSSPRARPETPPPGPHAPGGRRHPPHHRGCTDQPDAGWSSPVARQAHNLKAAGSNPAPATSPKAKKPSAELKNICSCSRFFRLVSHSVPALCQ